MTARRRPVRYGLNFAPATAITDAAGNGATGAFATASDFKLF